MSMDLLSCIHSKDSGKSPVGATQDMLTESPSLAGSLPNVNGVILGGTFYGRGEEPKLNFKSGMMCQML